MRHATRCTALKLSGDPCRATAQPGSDFCRWHDPSEEARARHREESRRGGRAHAAPLPVADPLSTVLSVASLNLSTAAGVRDLLAATMRQLTHLPLDVRVATAIGQLATSQRSLLETSDLEARLAALEAAQSDRPHLRAS